MQLLKRVLQKRFVLTALVIMLVAGAAGVALWSASVSDGASHDSGVWLSVDDVPNEDASDVNFNSEESSSNTDSATEEGIESALQGDERSSAASNSSRPAPVEPQDATINKDNSLKCYLSVSCSTVLNHMDWLTPGKESVIPSNGVIYARRAVTFYEGESVFDVLKREMRNSRIHFEYTSTPGYNSAYIEGINNLYELDCGGRSGWMYKVNGWYPNYGCSRYQVKSGDEIVWNYTCDLGNDLGA